MHTTAPPLMPIFRSRHQGELLSRLLLNPEQEFTLTELARAIGVPLPTLQREAQRLTEAGLIRDRRQGRNRLVSANPSNPATAPLTQLALLSFGPHTVIAEEFAFEGVEQVIIFGSWAARYAGQPGPPPNDIDVLVVGEVSRFDMFAAAERAEQRIGREVNPIECTSQQWANPGDWTLLAEVHERPHTTVYRREGSAA